MVRVPKAACHADHAVSPGVGLAAATSAFASVIRMPDTLGQWKLGGALSS